MYSSPPPAPMDPEIIDPSAAAHIPPMAQPDVTARLGQRLLALFMGAGFTLLLFLGIARYEKEKPGQPAPKFEDLQLTALPIEPPPPLTVPSRETEAAPTPGFEFSPSQSPVKVAVSPPSLAEILPEDMSRAPQANVRLGPVPADLKPRLGFLFNPEHIYQKSEVDRPPEILERPMPQVSSRIRDNADSLKVRLVAIIGADGSVGHVRLLKSSGNDDFDKVMEEFIKDWVFSPAMKGGKKVRCMIEQAITVQWTAGSPFTL